MPGDNRIQAWLIEDNFVLNACFHHLASTGLIFSSATELLEYAQVNNWMNFSDFEAQVTRWLQRLFDNRVYLFGKHQTGEVFQWLPDIGLIERRDVNDESYPKDLAERLVAAVFQKLETEGRGFSSSAELLRYASVNNWPNLAKLELTAHMLFGNDSPSVANTMQERLRPTNSE